VKKIFLVALTLLALALSLLAQGSSAPLRLVQTISLSVDGLDHRLYLGVPARGNEPAQIWTYEVQD